MRNITISKFEFSLARYIVGNGSSEVGLEIDYKNQTFKVELAAGLTDREFIQEVERIARGLIERKHGENFAWKFQNGRIDNSK